MAMDRKSQIDTDDLGPATEQIAFSRRRRGKYSPVQQTKLQNSLLAIVGYLEFANAMDFAANVWNTIPVPLFAAILMGIGGSAALIVSVFAFQDAVLSKRNINFLRNERRQLRKLKVEMDKEKGSDLLDVDAYLDFTFRELGTEMIDRIGMDSVMGFAAVLVGTGTIMAIGGANPKVYKVSNLFSGYIGNGLSAFYGVVNTGWSVFTWRRAQHHAIAGERYLTEAYIKDLQRRRNKTIKFHAILNGLTGLVAGVAGLITSTKWEGYVVLIPCIISAIYCNTVWRLRIGYERPTILHGLGRDIPHTIKEISFAVLAQSLIRESPSTALESLVSNSKSLSKVTDFIIMNGFFEDFSRRLLKDRDLAAAILGPLQSRVTIDSSELLNIQEPHIQAVLKIAEASIIETGVSTFRDRKRFLLDKMGCQLCVGNPTKVDVEMNEKQASDSEPNESSNNTRTPATPASGAEPLKRRSQEKITINPTGDSPSARVSLDYSEKEARDAVQERPKIERDEARGSPPLEPSEESSNEIDITGDEAGDFPRKEADTPAESADAEMAQPSPSTHRNTRT